MIKTLAEYAGGRDNADGEAWVKFDIPQSEVMNISPFLFFVDILLHMVVDINKERLYVGCAMSNNMTRTPKGNAIITLRGLKKNVRDDVIKRMPENSFELRLLTEAEMVQLHADAQAPQDTSTSAHTDALESDNTDADSEL